LTETSNNGRVQQTQLLGCVRKHHPTTLGCHSIFVYVERTIKIEWHPSVVGWCFRTQPCWVDPWVLAIGWSRRIYL